MLHVENLSRSGLQPVSLNLHPGECMVVRGPSGAGKSLLLRALADLDPSEGRVTLDGADRESMPAPRWRSLVGYVPAEPGWWADHTRDHFLDWDALAPLARRLGLRPDIGDDVVTRLSTGERQRLALLRALERRPRVLLLDEPTTGLDPMSRRNFLDALHRLHRERGMTVLMTSHVFSEAEDVGRVAIMREGKLLAYDSPQVLKARIGTEMVVVQPDGDAEAFAETLRAELGLAVRRHGDELRLEETENGEGLPLLERMLERYRPRIRSISIKQPDLDDVFVHVTSRAVPERAKDL